MRRQRTFAILTRPSAPSRSSGSLFCPVFTVDGDDWRGKIYDPRKDKTYQSILMCQLNGTLKVQGCTAFFCQTQVWTRAN